MRKITIAIMTVCLLLTGCENQQEQQGEYERVSEQIEQVKAESQGQEQPDVGQGIAVEPIQQVKTDVQEQEQVQAAERATEKLAGNIKLTVRMLTVDERDFEALDDLWGYTTGGFTIKRRPDIFSESGLKVHMAAGDLSAQLAAVREKAKYYEDNELFLVLANGTTGYINLGTEIAVPQFFYLTRWYKATNYQFRSAGRGFKVTARKIPERDLVNIQLIPVFSQFLSDGSDKKCAELMTSITVRPGQSVLVGGSRTSRANLSTALLGLRQEKVLKDTVILINASLL